MTTDIALDARERTLTETLRKGLLVCGLCASVLWIGADIFASLQYEGYSFVSQLISELSAVGAPTRLFLIRAVSIFAVLKLAYSVGVWMSAHAKRGLQIAAVLLFVSASIDLVGHYAPMHMRETLAASGGSWTDIVHIAYGVEIVLSMLLIVGFGAAADGRWFRLYSYTTIVVLVVADTLTFLNAPRIAAGVPTPWAGLVERTTAYGFMIWMAVLAAVLLRMPAMTTAGKPPGSIGAPQLTPR